MKLTTVYTVISTEEVGCFACSTRAYELANQKARKSSTSNNWLSGGLGLPEKNPNVFIFGLFVIILIT